MDLVALTASEGAWSPNTVLSALTSMGSPSTVAVPWALT